MPQLTAQTVAITSLSANTQSEMFSLYTNYYDATSPSLFFQDLKAKDYALLLTHEGTLKGFTTIKLLTEQIENTPIRVLYSGDTIIHHHHWGEQSLVRAWCKFSGQIKALHPDTPLYWLLITKGHRTYRFLPAFCRHYHPQKDKPSAKEHQQIIDKVSKALFNKAYNPSTGTLQFTKSKGHLKPKWADAEDYTHNKQVNYFLSKNPNYAKGEELVCVTELAESNLRFIAQTSFLQGLNTPQK